MALLRYNPWQEMNALQRQLNQLFDEGVLTTSERDLQKPSFSPSAELYETDEAFTSQKLEVKSQKCYLFLKRRGFKK